MYKHKAVVTRGNKMMHIVSTLLMDMIVQLVFIVLFYVRLHYLSWPYIMPLRP